MEKMSKDLVIIKKKDLTIIKKIEKLCKKELKEYTSEKLLKSGKIKYGYRLDDNRSKGLTNSSRCFVRREAYTSHPGTGFP